MSKETFLWVCIVLYTCVSAKQSVSRCYVMCAATSQALEVLLAFWVNLLVPPSGVLNEALIVCKFLNIALYPEIDTVVTMKSSNVSLICIILSYFYFCLSLLVTYLICLCCVVHLIKLINLGHSPLV